MSPVWAADEAAIQDLQSDVTVTKSKADKNAQDIDNYGQRLLSSKAVVQTPGIWRI
jgi:hypothetical protein